jgi:three-Cys-motif partner protein
MAHKDHHSKPYDVGTLEKLEIFERYIQAWLPTFIMQVHIEEVNIVDFFAGLGYDKEGQKGSPIRALEMINSLFSLLMMKKTVINLYLNEFDDDKFAELKKNCNQYLDDNKRVNKFVRIHYSSKDFDEIYNEIIEKTKDIPNLYIIDQSGIKFTNEKNFKTLLNLHRTDFLFFISSSFFKRFGEGEEFEKHLDISEDNLNKNPYKFIHRIVLEKYRSLIPDHSELMIFPFSIKKGANIYGIIFGSKHIVGVEKFLKIAWDKNKMNGEANYDIDEDSKKDQIELNFKDGFSYNKLKKIELFNLNLEEFIKVNKIVTNEDLYYFTYFNGHIASHTKEYLRILKKEKKIDYKGHPKISWKKIKEKDFVEFKWIG